MPEEIDPTELDLTDSELIEVIESHGVDRRSVMKALGVGTAVTLGSGTVAADHDQPHPPHIDSHYGYSAPEEEHLPEKLRPDRTVDLHVEEERIDVSNLPEVTVEFGAFHFHPVGMQIEPGSVVRFDFHSPEHTVSAFHPKQGRQLRVPTGVPEFSSPLIGAGGFWLYRFDEPGVYDLFCAPHEFGGMGMRIVVGDDPGDVVRRQGRPPFGLTAPLLGTGLPHGDPDIGHPNLDPENIVENGPIVLGDDSDPSVVDLDLAITLSGPAPAAGG